MFGKMKLRDKMTLWFTILTLLSVTVFSVAVYGIIHVVLKDLAANEIRLSLGQILSHVENEDGVLSFESGIPVPSDTMYFVTEENGSELFSYGADITLFDSVPTKPGEVRTISRETGTWLLLDSGVMTVDDFQVQVRVVASNARNERVLSTIRHVFLIALPVLFLLAIIGGRSIAGRSLQPIRQVVESANTIAKGDLSARIPPAVAQDELGEMTATLNHMLDNVEAAFKREKQFASDASHELRTPVAILRAYTETLIQNAGDDEERKASLNTILTECARMEKIISQLLTLTRGQEGRYPISMEEFALLPVFEGVREALTDKLVEKNNAFEISLDPSLTIQADQSLITELVLNLAENAIKYGKENGHIHASARQESDWVTLIVKDNGIGIPEETLPHIFERFYQADAARNRSGTGLGLSICDWIVKAHHGTIRAESKPGEGSSFIVKLPL